MGRLGGRSLVVTTATGEAYEWKVNPDEWSAKLAGALANTRHILAAI